jgi:CubicO group peptidase (beta-lactamase class C family)
MLRALRVWLAVLVVAMVLPLAAPAQQAAPRAPAQAPAKGKPAAKAPAAAPQPAKPTLDGADAFIDAQLKEWKVPGLAIAVVQDGKVILSKGYGFRDVEKQLPVTPKTLFAIGSVTKSFTVSVLGALAEEGKLEWDKPVREYLPAFRLSDPVATEHMTPLDLVTHRSGLPRHDLLWYGSSFTRREMFDRLRYLEPSKDFRELYQYNNLMFMTAGILASEIAHAKWEDLVRKRIFEPLGMTSSNFSVRDSQKADDFAQPYEEIKEKIEKVPFRNIDEIGPAGAINSNVEDMIRYVQMHLEKGKYGEKGEKKIISEATAARMQTAQMVVLGPEQPYTEVVNVGYGMGLGVGAYRGHKLVSHGGGIDGFTSSLSFMPNDKIAMMILTNRGGTPLPSVVSRYVYDRLLGLDVIDWPKRIKEQQDKQKKAEEESKKKAYTARREGTKPSHDLKEYAGEYEHPAYGIVRIGLEGDALSLGYNGFTLPLKHFHYDYFEVADTPREFLKEVKIQFFTNVKGDIASFSIPLETGVKDLVFARRGEKVPKDVLQTLVGEYILGAVTATISLEGETTLKLFVPGQPVYELLPTKGLSFDIKGLSGYSLEFKKDESGTIVEVAFFQPNGTFVARRK